MVHLPFTPKLDPFFLRFSLTNNLSPGLRLSTTPILANTTVTIPCWESFSKYKEVCATDLSMEPVDIVEIPDIAVKSLPLGWEKFPNIPPEVLPLLKEYNQLLSSEEPATPLPEVVLDTGDNTPKWSQPYQTTEYKR